MANIDSYFLNRQARQGSPHNFIKHLHRTNSIESKQYEEEQYHRVTPLLKRHTSQNSSSFGHRALSPRIPQKQNTFHNKFYESIVQSIDSKRNAADYGAYQKEMADLAAREIGRQTENQLMRKEIKRLKEEIQYLRENGDQLQRKNEQLLIYKSRVEILDREYQLLLREYWQMREEGMQNYGPNHIPLSMEEINDGARSRPEQGKLPNTKQVTSRIIPSINENAFNGRINWKKVTPVLPSPITQLEQARPTQGMAYDDLPLIESKCDSSSERQEQLYENRAVRQEARTLDMKEIDKSRAKQYERKCQDLEQQIMEIRRRNIELYKNCEEFEGEKLKYLETITQLKYEKSKMATDGKGRQSGLTMQLEKLNLEKEANHITLLELNQQITSDESHIKLLRLEKQELQSELDNAMLRCSALNNENEPNKVNLRELEQKHRKVELRLEQREAEWSVANQKNCQMEIEKKVMEVELEERRVELEQKKAELEEKNMEVEERKGELQEKSVQLEEKKQELKQRKEMIGQLERQLRERERIESVTQKPSLPEPTASPEPIPTTHPQMLTLIHEISLLRDHNTKMAHQGQLRESELGRLKRENEFLNDNQGRLGKALDMERRETNRLNQLRDSWRQIEVHAKCLKRIDVEVDHLWLIKEVEYDNINTILTKHKV